MINLPAQFDTRLILLQIRFPEFFVAGLNEIDLLLDERLSMAALAVKTPIDEHP